jgi:hypothetical protein
MCFSHTYRESMHRKVAFATLCLLALVALSFISPVQAQAQHCSAVSVSGRWALTTTGSIPGVGDVAAVGIYTADPSGHLTGSQTRSLAGQVAAETFRGTFSVKPNCTGSATIEVFASGTLARTSTLDLVYDDNIREQRAIFTSLVLPDGTSLPSVLTIQARRIAVRDND